MQTEKNWLTLSEQHSDFYLYNDKTYSVEQIINKTIVVAQLDVNTEDLCQYFDQENNLVTTVQNLNDKFNYGISLNLSWFCYGLNIISMYRVVSRNINISSESDWTCTSVYNEYLSILQEKIGFTFLLNNKSVDINELKKENDLQELSKLFFFGELTISGANHYDLLNTLCLLHKDESKQLAHNLEITKKIQKF
jgi:hypothetical protein